MNKNIIIGVIVLAVIVLGATFLLKSAPSQTMAPIKATVTQAPTESMKEPSATGSATSGEVKEVTVTGSNYKFDPKTITVKKGDKVKITFKSASGFHNFVIDELKIKTPVVETGKDATVEFTVDKTGTFQYYCSIANHKTMGMVGTLIVE